MPLLGPNCYGLVNYAAQALIWPDQHGGVGLGAGERGVAVVSQSSSIAISVTMVDIGLPLHSVVAVGNAAQLGVAQVGAALVECERVSALGLIVESLADLRAWETLAARARERRIGLVALVLGRSEQARRAVITHTASLTTDAAVGAEFLRRTGIGQVDSVDGLLGALCLLHCGGPAARYPVDLAQQLGRRGRADRGRRCRQTGELRAADQRGSARSCARHSANGWRWPTLSTTTPTSGGIRTRWPAAFTAMVRGPADLHLLFADLPRADRCTDEEWTLAIAAFARACAEAGARGALVAAMAANLAGGRAAAWVRRGLAVLAPPDVAMAAIDAAARVGQAWAGPAAPPVAGPDGRGGGAHGAGRGRRTRSGPSGCSATTGCRCPTAWSV